MALTLRNQDWSPFKEIEELSSRFNRLLGAARFDVGEGMQTDWSPSCNVSETEKEYRIQAELPSVKKEDVHVKFEGGLLKITGERKSEKEEKGEQFTRREISYGSFARRFALPDADESNIQATYKDGILHVIVGKVAKSSDKSREVQIQ